MRQIAIALGLAVALASCGTTDTDIKHESNGESELPYPDRIYVYDFAVSPDEIPADSAEVDRLSTAIDDPQATPARNKLEHDIAALLSERLVEHLNDLGLPAVRWHGQPPISPNAYSLEGQFLTIDEGSALKRMIIGFGAGGVEVRVLAQIYHLQSGTRNLLGEAEVSAESSKKPGLAATLPVSAAISGVGTATAVGTGIGLVTEMNTDVRKGVEDTAEAIIELLEPRMEDQGWL